MKSDSITESIFETVDQDGDLVKITVENQQVWMTIYVAISKGDFQAGTYARLDQNPFPIKLKLDGESEIFKTKGQDALIKKLSSDRNFDNFLLKAEKKEVVRIKVVGVLEQHKS